MKKSKFLMFAAIVCSSFFFASCSDNIESDGNGTQDDDVTLDVQVVDENPDTRFYLGSDNFNHFQINDEVAVWSNKNNTRVRYACVENGIIAKIKRAAGETQVLGQAPVYFAAYPNSAIISNNNSYVQDLVKIKYTTDQTFTESEIRNDQTKYKPILVGGTNMGVNHLKLYNASAMLKVTFVNTSSKTIKSVDVNTNGAACITNVYNTWADYYSGVNITDIKYNATLGTQDAGGCSPRRIKPITIAPGKAETIYFMLPMQSDTYNHNKYSFSAYESADGSGDAVVTKKLKDELALVRNKIYNFGTVTATNVAASSIKIEAMGNGSVQYSNAGTGVIIDNSTLIASSTTDAGTVNLVATPNTDFKFEGWYNQADIKVSSDATYNVNIKSNNGQVYTANFVPDPAVYAYPYYQWDAKNPMYLGTGDGSGSNANQTGTYHNNWNFANVISATQAQQIVGSYDLKQPGMKVETYYVTDAGPTTTVEIPSSCLPSNPSNYGFTNYSLISNNGVTAKISTNAGFYVRMSKAGSGMGTQAQYQALGDKTGFIFFPALGNIRYNGSVGRNILTQFGTLCQMWTSGFAGSNGSSNLATFINLSSNNSSCYWKSGVNTVTMSVASY